jgi:hypothetical protein
LEKKKKVIVNKRKNERRKPGDLRFPGRLVGVRKGEPRKEDRRKGERRNK